MLDTILKNIVSILAIIGFMISIFCFLEIWMLKKFVREQMVRDREKDRYVIDRAWILLAELKKRDQVVKETLERLAEEGIVNFEKESKDIKIDLDEFEKDLKVTDEMPQKLKTNKFH